MYLNAKGIANPISHVGICGSLVIMTFSRQVFRILSHFLYILLKGLDLSFFRVLRFPFLIDVSLILESSLTERNSFANPVMAKHFVLSPIFPITFYLIIPTYL